MNIIPVIFAFSWIFTEKQWILLQSTSFRSFLLSPEYFLTTNMNGALLNIIPVIFAFSWIFPENKYGCIFNQLHSGHICLFLNISWQKIQTTPFRSFLRSPEYFLTTNYGCCFNPPHSGHFCFLLNIFWQQIWTMLHWALFRSFLQSEYFSLTLPQSSSFLHFPEYFMRKM